ncbi:unnamed protein product [Candidula unifasciata]|uniref:DDB1- and CUL4-associated factor 8 n=1 Tax=Candidula unifasciata TaxID=100452 RepID=A0A8S3YGU9_9EUPU|nr:unnamed protein product [Candidula unifasciata]
MASSPSTEQSEDKKIEEDEGKDGKNYECQMIDVYRENPLDGLTLKKDPCEITRKSILSSKSGDDISETKSQSIYMNDGDNGDSEMKDADASDSVCLNDGFVTPSEHGHANHDKNSLRQDIELMETKPSSKSSSQITHDDELINGENDLQDDKDEVMSVDKDEPSATEAHSTLTLNSGANLEAVSSNDFGHAGSPATKRVSTDDDDDESPKPKRHTPDRSGEKTDSEDTVHNKKDANEANSTDPDQSKELPSLSSDSDDDDIISTPAGQRQLSRRRRLRRRRYPRQRFSSDDSDTTGEDDTNDGVKNTDEDDDKESDEEVRKAISEILNKPCPKPNWYAVPELRKREYGYGSHQDSSSFVEHVQGSLHMARKLVLKESMKGHEGCVNALSFNRIGTLLASGSDDLNIILWNWQRARPSLIYDSGHRSNVFQAKFMPFSGDCHVISCARDGQVRLAELSLTGVCKTTRKLAQHRGAAHKLALELDSPNVFLSCGEDAVTYLFDLREEKPHKLVTTKENDKKVPLYSIHSNPCDSRQFCVGGRDHYIRVYDKRKISEDIDGGVLKKFCPDHLINSEVKANVTCACYNYNGTEILGSYNDEDIYLFDNTMSDGANYIHKYTGHRNNATVKGVNFYGPKSEFIISGSDCGHVFFWEKHTEAIINFQEGDDAGVINVLEPHPTLPVLATSGLDHDVKLWMPSNEMPKMDLDVLKKTLKRNHNERTLERVSSEPEMIGGQMLWFIMHHFRNSARRRMREEGQVLSTSDDDENESHSEGSDTNEMQCAQS